MASRRDQQLLEARLRGKRIAIDVQHLYRSHLPLDKGAVYTLANGQRVTEAWAATLYADAMATWFRSRGAEVLTNSTRLGTLIGYYSRRQTEAMTWRADVYLACHVNAGRGSYARACYATGNVGNPQLAERVGVRLNDTFAEILTHQVVAMSPGDRGLACVARFTGPHLLLEPFFGDNPRQQGLLAGSRLQFLGETIALAIADWLQFGAERREVPRTAPGVPDLSDVPPGSGR